MPFLGGRFGVKCKRNWWIRPFKLPIGRILKPDLDVAMLKLFKIFIKETYDSLPIKGGCCVNLCYMSEFNIDWYSINYTVLENDVYEN